VALDGYGQGRPHTRVALLQLSDVVAQLVIEQFDAPEHCTRQDDAPVQETKQLLALRQSTSQLALLHVTVALEI
jgi:hypothetical protein